MTHRHTNGPEHDFEPVHGLPAELPDDEHIVWQGHPETRSIMRFIMRGRWIAGYLAILILWTLITGYYDGRSLGAILFSGAAVTILSAIVVTLMELFSWGVRKTTVYTVTNKRIVMRIGVALSVTYNIPFKQITGAEMLRNDDGTGNIALTLTKASGLSWFAMWPHVRGSIFAPVTPRLTGLKDVEAVASDIALQLGAHLARGHDANDGSMTIAASTILEAAE